MDLTINNKLETKNKIDNEVNSFINEKCHKVNC